jgi:7-cyano-7-deazaguanine synthase
MDKRPRAICLLSGGIDSAVAAKLAQQAGYEVIAMSIEYGNPAIEKCCAVMISDWLGTEKPLFKPIHSMNPLPGPSNYFPARNTIFFGFAIQLAEQRDAAAIIIGANRDDYDDYPDCRPEYIDAFEKMARIALRRNIQIWTPLIEMTKAQVVKRAVAMGVPLEKTISCYRPRDRTPCGICNACLLRKKAYEANGLEFKLERLEVDFGESKPWLEDGKRT